MWLVYEATCRNNSHDWNEHMFDAQTPDPNWTRIWQARYRFLTSVFTCETQNKSNCLKKRKCFLTDSQLPSMIFMELIFSKTKIPPIDSSRNHAAVLIFDVLIFNEWNIFHPSANIHFQTITNMDKYINKQSNRSEWKTKQLRFNSKSNGIESNKTINKHTCHMLVV